ncbi:MAG: acyl-CoA dehydrogenase family protein, partial [Proteobacteria bacterium]|nr:acyl-CoA dehydrogenase family protein [Pseudomonadota bacterium]
MNIAELEDKSSEELTALIHEQGIANGDEYWCTLYSEPGSGSDLASLQTKAVRDGDDYVINGSKTWTSGGHLADMGWLAA